jgi:hypothetical protein
MRAEPIKGTRRRASDPADDAALRTDLETSLKDRAENIMIVDLLRNDLSHFAIPGSVTVSRLCAIESYATVHQMVSTIDAQLRRGSSRAEAVAACFPAGSMTGRAEDQHHRHPGPAGRRCTRPVFRRHRLLFAEWRDRPRRCHQDPGDQRRQRRNRGTDPRRRRRHHGRFSAGRGVRGNPHQGLRSPLDARDRVPGRLKPRAATDSISTAPAFLMHSHFYCTGISNAQSFLLHRHFYCTAISTAQSPSALPRCPRSAWPGAAGASRPA